MGEVYWITRHHHRPLRVHHGFAGVLLALFGALLMLHDRRDYRDWIWLR